MPVKKNMRKRAVNKKSCPAGLPGWPCCRAQDFTPGNWRDWRWQLRNSRAFWPPAATPQERVQWRRLARLYPCRITPYYASLIDWNNSADPLRRQCLPDLRELADAGQAADDPLGEKQHMPVPGLLRRYRNRALAMVTSACALYCRHCTRKNFWRYRRPQPTRAFLQKLVHAVARLPDVREVIVSGGDPLLLEDELLDWFLGALRAVPHVETLRIGTRVPVVLPMRITRRLCALLARHRPLWINTQFNHPREITPQARRACDMLLKAGLPVSNQTVLLRGVNDDFETLAALNNGLQRMMVRPYYLFQCDPVPGLRHFRTPLAQGVALADKLRAELGGLCVPQFVIDLAECSGKLPLQPNRFVSLDKHGAILRGLNGQTILYREPSQPNQEKKHDS